MQLRALSVAVASGRTGAVFLVGDKLKYWCQSTVAATNPVQTVDWTEKLIKILRPQLIIIEDRGPKCHKGPTARAAIEVIERTAVHASVECTSVVRMQPYANKYAEATALVAQFPELTTRQPKHRQIWDSEPRSTIVFEALSMAVDVLDIRADYPGGE